MHYACYNGQSRQVSTCDRVFSALGRCPVIDFYKMSSDRRQKCSLPVKPDVFLLPETFRKLCERKEERSREKIREIKMIILSKYARKSRRFCLYSCVETFNCTLLKSEYQKREHIHIPLYMTGTKQEGLTVDLLSIFVSWS